MNTLWKDLWTHLRVIWAIARKDIVDAIRNKTILGVMLGVLMLMLSGRALPMLLGLSGTKSLVVYDPHKSRVILGLRKQEGLRLYRVSSLQEMEVNLSTAADIRLGLVLPAGFDRAVADGQVPELDAYAAHWASRDEVAEQRAFLEQALVTLTGQPVRVRVAERRIYPPADGQGFTSMATRVIVLVITTVGMFMVPYFIADEKQTRTMDALLVSPASIRQIVAGKAVAGSVYCLGAAAVAMAFNHAIFVHWGVVILAVACGTLFAIGVGLMLGSLFDMPQHVNALAGVLLVIFTVPMYLADRASRFPAVVRAILPCTPSAALDTALKISLLETVPMGALWTNLGIVLGISAVVYAITVWRIRRMDR